MLFIYNERMSKKIKMTKKQLKAKWIFLSEDYTLEKAYFYGTILDILEFEEKSNVVLIEGFLDNNKMKKLFPHLSNILNKQFFTPVKLFVNGGKMGILDDETIIKTLINLEIDFTTEKIPYLISEKLNENRVILERVEEKGRYFSTLWNMTQSEAKENSEITFSSISNLNLIFFGFFLISIILYGIYTL